MMIRDRFILLALLSSIAQSLAQNPLPLWELNLEKFGYQGRPPAALAHLSENDLTTRFGTAIFNQGVVFTDPSVAVAYFVVHDDSPGSAEPRVPLISDPFHLVAVFLNVRNGEVTKKLEWTLPADSQNVSRAPAKNGGVGGRILSTSKLGGLHHRYDLAA
jgi:hypothetical protein